MRAATRSARGRRQTRRPPRALPGMSGSTPPCMQRRRRPRGRRRRWLGQAQSWRPRGVATRQRQQRRRRPAAARRSRRPRRAPPGRKRRACARSWRSGAPRWPRCRPWCCASARSGTACSPACLQAAQMTPSRLLVRVAWREMRKTLLQKDRAAGRPGQPPGRARSGRGWAGPSSPELLCVASQLNEQRDVRQTCACHGWTAVYAANLARQ